MKSNNARHDEKKSWFRFLQPSFQTDASLYPAWRTRTAVRCCILLLAPADPNRMTLSYHVIVKFKHSWPAAFAVGYSKTFPASDNLSGGSGLRGVTAASECMTAAVTVDRSSTDWWRADRLTRSRVIGRTVGRWTSQRSLVIKSQRSFTTQNRGNPVRPRYRYSPVRDCAACV
jgi:hypothetical protein